MDIAHSISHNLAHKTKLPEADPIRLGHTLANYAIEAMHAHLGLGGLALMEHPEDLGKCPSEGVPAARWQFAECISL